jgi:uncharacterized protein with PIN domain
MIDASLVSRIKGRRVIVDACVSRDLANNLKNSGLVVRHVADINTALKDHEIAKMMHEDEVLITRDYRFYKMLGEARAILLAPGSNTVGRSGKLTRKDKPEIRRKNRLPSHVRIALREKLAEEARTGLLYAKILWGIMWLIGFPVP